MQNVNAAPEPKQFQPQLMQQWQDLRERAPHVFLSSRNARHTHTQPGTCTYMITCERLHSEGVVTLGVESHGAALPWPHGHFERNAHERARRKHTRLAKMRENDVPKLKLKSYSQQACKDSKAMHDVSRKMFESIGDAHGQLQWNTCFKR